MKNIIKTIIAGLVLAACSDGYIDDITQVSTGEDASAPQVTIATSGTTWIASSQTSANLNFIFTVVDDIEISKVDLLYDGVVIETFDNFLDYRNFTKEYPYSNIAVGDHTLTVNAVDKAGKTTTATSNFTVKKYFPILDSEVFYMPFDNDYMNLINLSFASTFGAPTIATGGFSGNAYKGATDSYLIYPLAGLYSSEGISFTFRYKVDAAPTRAGIITINDNEINTDENRKQGIRIFREGGTAKQRIKLNVGTGTADSWNDGAEIDVNNTWVHIAVTISPTESKIYFDGVLQRTSTYSAFDLSTSTNMVIGSGAPSFTYWSHNSDLSLIDDLRVYNKALTQEDVAVSMQ
ncbi:MAG: LamG domain-containing protein [Bergeyella sp.]